MHATAPSLSWLTEPAVFEVNRLPAHSDHHWRVGGRELAQTLDGAWRFFYSPRIADRPSDFWRPDADLSDFGTITVPGHIELQGYGQIQYVNTQYPWDGLSALRPPEIDADRTAVGSYVRDFELDPAWADMRTCVSFQGVERAFYLWCNGSFVGYAEDSFTPSDFDLTPYLHPGTNRLAVEVYQHASASWLEDQDMFRFFGIFRPVVLYAKPAWHIEDLWLRAELDQDNATGTLRPRLVISAPEGTPADALPHAHITVADPTGTVELARSCELVAEANDVGEEEADVEVDELPTHPGARTFRTAEELRIEPVQCWSHNAPALYTVTLALYDPSGTEVESVSYRIGFRRVEIIDGVLTLNGDRLFFRGVNRHEWSPTAGRAIGIDDMRRAMETITRNNINAVRTSHYPNQTPWYDLCDEHGIYLIDEANLETHGSWQKLGRVDPAWNIPGSDPVWLPAVIDRARSMFERDKNHASVVMWSCGNESFAGEVIAAMSRYFHASDPSRPVHYEGVFPTRGHESHRAAWEEISDVESRMYASPAEVRAYLEGTDGTPGPRKPFVLCEYMHDMGNSLGGMEDYLRLGAEFPQFAGGFIWDFMDQALWRRDALGRRALGYGGDFGERPSDYAFSGDGIVFADGTEKPAMQEVRYWYADEPTRAAHDAQRDSAAKENARRFAECAAERRTASDLADDLVVVEGDVNLGVRDGKLEVLFSWAEHGPVSIKLNGTEWLYRAPRPAFWRAATENDRGCGFAERASVWLAADANPRCIDQQIEERGPRRVSVCYRFASDAVPGAEASLRYTVEAGCGMLVEAEYHGAPGLPELPCFGLRLATPAPVREVVWTGLSGETYPDRWRGGRFGRWSEGPHVPPYLVPQECGCHVRTQELELVGMPGSERCDRGGAGAAARLRAVMEEVPFSFSALPVSALELETADHREDLPKSTHTHVTLYGAMRGVGGIDSWGSDVTEPYRLSSAADYRLAVRVLRS